MKMRHMKMARCAFRACVLKPLRTMRSLRRVLSGGEFMTHHTEISQWVSQFKGVRHDR